MENRMEACIVTEIWLSDGDDTWIRTGDFTKNNYHSVKQTDDERRWPGINL